MSLRSARSVVDCIRVPNKMKGWPLAPLSPHAPYIRAPIHCDSSRRSGRTPPQTMHGGTGPTPPHMSQAAFREGRAAGQPGRIFRGSRCASSASARSSTTTSREIVSATPPRSCVGAPTSRRGRATTISSKQRATTRSERFSRRTWRDTANHRPHPIWYSIPVASGPASIMLGSPPVPDLVYTLPKAAAKPVRSEAVPAFFGKTCSQMRMAPIFVPKSNYKHINFLLL